MKNQKDNVASFGEILRFCVAGSIVIGVDFGVYYLMSGILPLDAAKGVSFTCAGIVGYLINKYWTFRQRQSSAAEMLRYFLANTLALGINILLNKGGLWLVPQPIWPALIVATFLTSAFTYVAFKWWVFDKHG